jgi:hypothetical protein
MPCYVVRPEPPLLQRRKVAFDSLSSARYFARTWAFRSRVPILVVDARTGRAVERYSSRPEPIQLQETRI